MITSDELERTREEVAIVKLKVIFWHLGTEENHDTLDKNSWCSGQFKLGNS